MFRQQWQWYDDGYDWKIVADKLNNDQQTTFQLYVTIEESVIVSGLLTDNEIIAINILNSDSENDRPEKTLNMIVANQTMSSLQMIRQFVEIVEGFYTQSHSQIFYHQQSSCFLSF